MTNHKRNIRNSLITALTSVNDAINSWVDMDIEESLKTGCYEPTEHDNLRATHRQILRMLSDLDSN